jgi:hypothetical protein
MAKTPSTMLDLGTAAPDFSLPDVVSGKTASLAAFANKKALLVMFICRHCASLKEMAEQLGFAFPFCYDESQTTAKAYSAACTPDFFLFDQSRELVYRGQLDDSRPESGLPVTGRDLRNALDAVLNDGAVNPDQRASIGCNIKWKTGNEPAYSAAA